MMANIYDLVSDYNPQDYCILQGILVEDYNNLYPNVTKYVRMKCIDNPDLNTYTGGNSFCEIPSNEIWSPISGLFSADTLTTVTPASNSVFRLGLCNVDDTMFDSSTVNDGDPYPTFQNPTGVVNTLIDCGAKVVYEKEFSLINQFISCMDYTVPINPILSYKFMLWDGSTSFNGVALRGYGGTSGGYELGLNAYAIVTVICRRSKVGI